MLRDLVADDHLVRQSSIKSFAMGGNEIRIKNPARGTVVTYPKCLNEIAPMMAPIKNSEKMTR
jgi:hypothetical protein